MKRFFISFLIIATLLGFSSWAYSEGMTGGGPGMTGQSGFQSIYRSNEYRLMDTDRTHYLRIIAGSDLTANRLLTLTTGDAARTITLSGNPTLADWFDQAVKTSSTPVFPTVYGSASASGTLTLESTSHATKGDLFLSLSTTGALLIGNKTAVGSWGGDGVSDGTTTITDVGGAAHGLSLAAGNLVHITAGTGSVEGFYTIISDNGTSVVVDRTVSAATDLSVTFYKDVIGIFATDGTNGQRIMNYSHQNKPMQIGGHVSSTSTGYTSEDVTLAGALWVDASTGYVKVGDGTSVPQAFLDIGIPDSYWVGYRVHIGGDTNTTGTLVMTLGTDSTAVGPQIIFNRFRGTHAAKTTVVGDNVLGVIQFAGYNDDTRSAAIIRGEVETGVGATGADMPGRLVFLTTPDGSETPLERVRIDNQGNFGIKTTSFGTSLVGGLAMGNGTAATAALANGWQIWSADFLGGAGDARMHIMGEGSADARTILGSGKVTVQGTTGGVTTQIAEATATLSGASTTIQTNVPSGSRIIAVQLRVDTLITSGDGGTTWTAVFVNVPTTAITSGQAFTKNTKFSKNTADEIATGEVDITITPNAGTFSAGVVRAIITYELYDTMADAA